MLWSCAHFSELLLSHILRRYPTFILRYSFHLRDYCIAKHKIQFFKGRLYTASLRTIAHTKCARATHNTDAVVWSHTRVSLKAKHNTAINIHTHTHWFKTHMASHWRLNNLLSKHTQQRFMFPVSAEVLCHKPKFAVTHALTESLQRRAFLQIRIPFAFARTTHAQMKCCLPHSQKSHPPTHAAIRRTIMLQLTKRGSNTYLLWTKSAKMTHTTRTLNTQFDSYVCVCVCKSRRNTIVSAKINDPPHFQNATPSNRVFNYTRLHNCDGWA